MEVLEVSQLGFQIQDMKQVKKDVRILLRTSSFGFTLIETVVTLLINTLIIVSFIQIISFIPIKKEDVFTQEKIKIRSYENLSCLEGKLHHNQTDLSYRCIETTSLIQVFVEEKVFYVKKYTGIYSH